MISYVSNPNILRYKYQKEIPKVSPITSTTALLDVFQHAREQFQWAVLMTDAMNGPFSGGVQAMTMQDTVQAAVLGIAQGRSFFMQD